ncbi:putative heat shock protein 70 family protein [Tanacetum coccineum]
MQGKASETPGIGIDLGTTYSCVAVWRNGRIEIIPNDQGNRTTPSAVAFLETERLIGEGAKNQVAMNPASTIFVALAPSLLCVLAFTCSVLYCVLFWLQSFSP